MEEPVVDPAAEASEETAVEPEVPWAPSQDEWQQFTGAVTYLAQLEQERARVYQPRGEEQPQGEFDPYDRNQLRALFREEMHPYQEFQQQQQLAEAEERALDILDNLSKSGGEFDVAEARIRADHLLPQMQEKFGWGPRAAEAALEEAAKQQREYELRLEQRGVSKYTNQVSTLAGAATEPGSAYAQGVTQRTVPDFRKGGSVTDRFFTET
jgi:hypothetical protein